MKRTLKFLSFAAISGLLFGCYPEGPELVGDLDVVYTTYDDTYNFAARSTYAMPDSIVTDVEIDRDGDTSITYMGQQNANRLLAEIENQMADNGWTRVGIDQNPDMLLTPAGMSTTNYFYSYWYDWWYSDWYYWWGWYYPPYYNISSYTTGSFFMVLSDPNEDNIINTSQAKWVAVCNGILTQTGNISRVTDAIDQAFDQSEYLDRD